MPPAVSLQLHELRQRRVDVILGRVLDSEADDDLHTEFLFHDPVRVVAGEGNKWLRRRRIELAELLDEPWILTPPDSLPSSLIREAFSGKGLDVPRPSVVSTSIHIVNRLLPNGPYLTPIPESVLRFGPMGAKIRALRVDFPCQPRPTAIITLKNRTLNPVADLFIQAARAVAKPLANASSK